MKTNVLLLNLQNPIPGIRRTMIAMLMVLFTSMVYSQTTVVDIIVNSDVHESLEDAVIAAGLADALSGDGPFTVFAPTDDAFAALGQETIDALFDDPTGDLAAILQYHVVDANVLAGDLSDGQIVEMLEGTDAFVSLFDEMAYINQAMITVKDLVADNGVVHVIDAVMTQPKSIVDIVVNSPRHESLEAAVIAADLAGALSAEGTFTLFAPTDDAFAALGQETIDALFDDPTGDLADILKYHVVGAVAFSGDLSDGDMFTTLAEKDIKITINEDGVFVNNAKVIFADYEAPNGVVHVVDAVVLEPTATGIEDRFADAGNVSVYPNPARNFFNISYEIKKESPVTLEMYNMTGLQVGFQDQGYTYEGSYTVEFPVNHLEAGMYIIIINTADSQIANKVRVVK